MKAVVLTRGRIATVDDEDFDRVSQFKWCADKRGAVYYGRRNLICADGVKTSEYLHHFILGEKGTDHKDGDGLNNQKGNLRRASKQQNAQSHRRKKKGASSPFRGVSWHSQIGKWRANIKISGKFFHLGIFTDESDAALAYDKAARERFGEFAAPNFL